MELIQQLLKVLSTGSPLDVPMPARVDRRRIPLPNQSVQFQERLQFQGLSQRWYRSCDQESLWNFHNQVEQSR